MGTASPHRRAGRPRRAHGGALMPGFALSGGCRAPVEEVWKLLFDPARFPQWWAGVETVRARPPGEFTLWPTGYPDFPTPPKLRVDQANEPITIPRQVPHTGIVRHP